MVKAVNTEGVCSICTFKPELTSQGPVPSLREAEDHLSQTPCEFIKTGRCEAAAYIIQKAMEVSAQEAGV